MFPPFGASQQVPALVRIDRSLLPAEQGHRAALLCTVPCASHPIAPEP
jgi:hypothetical protein